MSSIEIFNIVASLMGGLALFLFGMSTMSDSLSALSGGVLDKTMDWVTKNRITAFLFGTVLTAVVQSASAISVLTVGLVNSGIIKLGQAIGLLIGANLGTTATAWLLSLNAVDGSSLLMTIIKPSSFTPFLAIISVALIMFAKKEKTISIANALLGFSIMMIGMTLMGSGVEPLRELPALQKVLVSFSNPVMGFLFAMLFTMLIQSSDATVGIIQAFALSAGVQFGMAIPLICGAQTGTCITALLSSMGTSNNGKRTAFMNLYYNLLKTIPFMLIFYGIDSVMHFSFLTEDVGGIGIPICHSLINIFGAAIWLPCGSFIIALAKKTIPYSEAEKREYKNRLTMLDKNLLRSPLIALEQTDRAIMNLADTTGQTMRSLVPNNSEEETGILLDRMHSFGVQIDHYLANIATVTLSNEQATFAMLLTNVNSAFTEIGETLREIKEMLSLFGDEAAKGVVCEMERTEIRVLSESIAEIIELTIFGYEEKDLALSDTIQIYREEMISMSDIVKRRHILRTHSEGRTSATALFADICRTHERLIEYCDIIADSLIRYNESISDTALETRMDKDEMRKRVRKLFMDKYQIMNIGTDENGQLIDNMQSLDN